MERFAEEYTQKHIGKVFDIRMLALFCVAMRRSTVEEIGLLDERFGIGMFEDDDYAVRVKEKGYSIICAEDVFVHHWGSASFSRLADAKYRAIFEEKWGRKWEPHRYRGDQRSSVDSTVGVEATSRTPRRGKGTRKSYSGNGCRGVR
jgi:GT2 family glycosyltransferase